VSKKPARSRHRIPTLSVRPSDPVDERYQAEVDASVSRLTRRYEAAHKRLEKAVVRALILANLPTPKPTEKRLLADVMAEVQRRREELAEIERLMMPGDYTRVRYRPVA
jgi:tRNA(Glu) U13 pseudouridine synthase TruD